MTNNNVPEVRFGGFNDVWVKNVLKNELELLKDGTHGTHKDTKDTKDGVYLLSAKNIKNGKVNISSDDRRISYEEYSKIHRNFELKSGDILLTVVGSIGEVAMLNDPKNITFQRSVAYLRPSNIDSLFLYTQARGANFQKELKNRQVVSAQPGVYLGDIGKIELIFPNDINEQQKIGEFFKQLDDRIALQQRYVEQLKQSKQGFLQKMFPKDGESVPEVRFDGFSGEWIQNNFMDTIQSIIDFRGKTPKKLGMSWSETGYPALSALNVKNGYIDFNSSVHFASEELYNAWMGDKELEEGQVLFTTEAPMGNVAQIPDNNRYVLSQRTIAFRVDKKHITNNFLAVLLRSDRVFQRLSALASGGTAKGVSQKSLSALKVVIPINLEEQQKIGEFFKQLDDLIAKNERELELLQETKKGFLQKMFV
jgi:type I restriction enzyme S subunit